MSEDQTKFGFRPAIWTSSGINAFEAQLRLAELGEEMGFDGIFFGDRMLSAVGEGDASVYGSTHTELFVTLTALAARTTRIRLGSLVLVVPFRHPVQLAKMVASLDLLSEGRLLLPVGGGWNEQEFKTMGINRAEAGERLVEGIEIMRLLWDGQPHDFDGQFYHFEEVAVEPRPYRTGGPPIWLGSFSPAKPAIFSEGTISAGLDRVLNRIGKYADGWAPLLYSTLARKSISPSVLKEAWDRVQASAEAEGRGGAVDFVFSHWFFIIDQPSDEAEALKYLSGFFPGDLGEARDTYLIGSVDQIVDKVGHLTSEIGCLDWMIFTQIGANQRQLELLNERVLPQLR